MLVCYMMCASGFVLVCYVMCGNGGKPNLLKSFKRYQPMKSPDQKFGREHPTSTPVPKFWRENT
jgi:hypothetical protein